jgi:plastocyanin
MKKTCLKLFANYEGRPLMLIALTTAVTVGAWSASPANGIGRLTRLVQVASAAEPASPVAEIKIDNFVFQPAEMTIKAGTQVMWTNKDDIPHTVDSTDGKFKSAALDTDEKFQFRFTEPGEYPFYCRMHPKMTGKIVVQP